MRAFVFAHVYENTLMDRYTKVVLTIIAAALCALVFQNAIPQASARTDYNCGWRTEPCHVLVTNDGWRAVPVEIVE